MSSGSSGSLSLGGGDLGRSVHIDSNLLVEDGGDDKKDDEDEYNVNEGRNVDGCFVLIRFGEASSVFHGSGQGKVCRTLGCELVEDSADMLELAF